MSDLTRQDRDAYYSGHWHDKDPKGSPALTESVDFDAGELMSELYTAMTNALNGYKRKYYGPRKHRHEGVSTPAPTVAGKRQRR